MLSNASFSHRGAHWRAQYTGATLLALLVWLPAHAQPTPARGHSLSAGGGQLRVALQESATAGVVAAPPGAFRSNLSTAGQVDLLGGSLDYRYTRDTGLPGWLDPGRQTTGLSYRLAWARFSGDETTAATVPQGVVDVGFIQTKFFPPPAPVVVIPGAVGLASQARVKVDSGRLQVGVSWTQQVAWLSAATLLQPRVDLGWTQFDYFVRSDDRFLDPAVPPAEFRDERDQRLQHDIFDVTLGARLEHFFGRDDALSVFADAGASLYFLKATLVSYEFITLNGVRRRRFTGGGAREFSLGGEATVGTTWRLGRAWQASAALQYRPWVPTGSINNPRPAAAGSASTFLGTGRESQTMGLLSLTYTFGAKRR